VLRFRRNLFSNNILPQTTNFKTTHPMNYSG